MATKKMMVSWFSAGVSSAVATKLLADEIDQLIYNHIDDQHPDTLRFKDECGRWFGKEVKTLRSDRVKNVEQAVLMFPSHGIGRFCPCTRLLKTMVRKQWEREQEQEDVELTYVWGLDSSEAGRAERICDAMPKQKHRFPLIEGDITKDHAHRILTASGIARPMMYELGYHNNNCIGCVKGGMGYWNKIRVDFPDVFAERAALERRIGKSCINGVFLDELDPERGRHEGPIVADCGIFCELEKLS